MATQNRQKSKNGIISGKLDEITILMITVILCLNNLYELMRYFIDQKS